MAATTSLKASPEAVDALRGLALRMSADLGRRISMSDTLLAVCQVARQHLDDLSTTLEGAEE